MFYISEATENDIPAIRSIAEETWWPTYSHVLTKHQIRYMLDAIYAAEVLQKDITDGIQTFLLLNDIDGPQGFASYGPRKEEPGVYKLHKLYVHPRNQRKACGRLLVEEVIKRLLKMDIHTLDLNVNRFNSARAFYEKSGFVLIREEDVPMGPYWMNDFVMRKQF